MKTVKTCVLLAVLSMPVKSFAQFEEDKEFKGQKFGIRVVDVQNEVDGKQKLIVSLKKTDLSGGEESYILLATPVAGSTPSNKNFRYSKHDTAADGLYQVSGYLIDNQKLVVIRFPVMKTDTDHSYGNPCQPEDDMLQLVPEG